MRARNIHNQTPLDLAEIGNHKEVINFLSSVRKRRDIHVLKTSRINNLVTSNRGSNDTKQNFTPVILSDNANATVSSLDSYSKSTGLQEVNSTFIGNTTMLLNLAIRKYTKENIILL